MGLASDEAARTVRRRPAVVGFVGAYFWQTIDVLAVAGLAVRAYPVARAEFESDARRRAERAIALIRRDD